MVISNGTIEAHFHFFIMIGLIALYQDWVPLGVNIGLTVISHGLGSALQANLIFNHPAAQQNPWLWAGIHGVAVLVAYAGVVAFWGITEDDQNDRVELTRRLTEARAAQQAAALEDINAVFLNIAHRSQAIVHRQLQVLDKAERAEEDPDQLGLLFQLDHLTTRERRNAENLIILGGGQPGRQWRNPVPLLELVRSAASETEQYTRVALGRMPRMMVAGRAVGDLIHLIAELLDNATSFSPPDARIDVRGNRVGKGVVLEIEDQGLGIEPERMEQLNEMLRSDSNIGPSAKSQDWRLGLFVVSRLARRHGINVTLVESAYGGVRAIALIPMTLLTDVPEARRRTTTAAVTWRWPAPCPPPRRRPTATGTATATATGTARSRGPGSPQRPAADAALVGRRRRRGAPVPADSGPETGSTAPRSRATAPAARRPDAPARPARVGRACPPASGRATSRRSCGTPRPPRTRTGRGPARPRSRPSPSTTTPRPAGPFPDVGVPARDRRRPRSRRTREPPTS